MKKHDKRRYDFSNLGNAEEFENAATSVADLTRWMVRAVQSGDEKEAEAFVRSEAHRLFQDQLRQRPEYITTSYTYNCVAAYISAIGAMSSFSEAERLLDKTTHARFTSAEEYLAAMSAAIISFTRIVGAEKRRHSAGGYTGRACAFVRDHLFTPFELGELADYCGCSLSRLRHVFKEEKGISLVGYIRAEKIEKAKQMLRDTDFSVAQIASQLGFCSESYFIEVFKKTAGCTPRRYKMC